MLVFQITALGLLTFFTVFASGSKCPKETLTRHVVCYYKGEVPLSNLTLCDCTHLIFTNAITKNVNHSLDLSEGIKDDLALVKERKSDLTTIFTLTLKEDQSSAILKSKNKTQKVIDEISKVLEEIQFDGVELDFKFSKGDGVSKDSYVSFVKHLSKSITSHHRRVKREEVEENEESEENEDETTSSTTETETTTDTTTPLTTSKDITTTALPELEEKEKKPKKQQGNDSSKAVELKNNTQTITNSSDSINDDLKKFLLLIRIPIQLEILGKKYDLKALTKYADILTVPTHHIFNEKESHLTYHPSRLMGLSDIFNTDSILDFLTGMGADKSKIIISLPSSVLKFQLKDETKNAPGSPAVSGPIMLNQAQLCSMLKTKNWTLERDEDLTAPYAFSGKTWLAFEDEISVKIKGKYILLRELAGGAIYPIDEDINDKTCTNSSTEGGYLTSFLFNSFKSLERKPRALVLQNLQEEIHDNTPFSTIEAGVQLSEYRIVRVVDHSGAVHVIRKNTKTQFECSRQGYFSHPLGCNKFYRCVKFDQYSDEFTVFEYDCPAGLAFDERWEVCVWPGSLPNGAPCTGSSEIAPVPRSHFRCPNQEGYYADPENCRWFFVCLDHTRDSVSPLTAYEFRCPFGLVFNAEKLACDWPWLVGGCGAQGAQEYIFGQAGGSASASNTAVFINGGNLEASLGKYGATDQNNFLGQGFGTVLNNIDRSGYGKKIQNSYSGSQGAANGFIASPFDDNSRRGSFAAFPDYEISGGRIFNKGSGVVLEENVNFAGGVDGSNTQGFKFQSGYVNNGNGAAAGSGSNAGYFGYSGLGSSDAGTGTRFGEKNTGSVYVNNGHLGRGHGIRTGAANANRNAAFSGKFTGTDNTNLNSAGGYSTGQFYGQDGSTSSGKSRTEHTGFGLSGVNTVTQDLGLDGGVQQSIVKAGQSSFAFNNVNSPINGQVLHNQGAHIQELLPPSVESAQPQKVLISSNPVPTQQSFAVNYQSVQVNEEKNIDGNGLNIATPVTSFGLNPSTSHGGSIISQNADLSHGFGQQYSTGQDVTYTPSQPANLLPVTTAQNKGSIASSGVSFGFSGTTPTYQTNKVASANTGYSAGISLNQGSVTTSLPILPTTFSSHAQRKGSKTSTLSTTAAPISSATPTPGAYSYQEFSSYSQGDYSSSAPGVPVVGFSSSDYSAGNGGSATGIPVVGYSSSDYSTSNGGGAPTVPVVGFSSSGYSTNNGVQNSYTAKVPQTSSVAHVGVAENSNFEQSNGVTYKQEGISYSLPSVTQSTTTFHSSDSSLKNSGFGLFNSKASNYENNKFGQGQLNFNLPSAVSVTPISQFGQSGSSGYHFTKEDGTTNEVKSNNFAFSTPKVELNLPVVTSTSTYEGFKSHGFDGSVNVVPAVTSTGSSHGFGQNLEFNGHGNVNQELLHPTFPSVTPKIEFTTGDKKTQSGSVHISQSSSHFSNVPNTNHQYDYTSQISGRPNQFAYESVSQTPRPSIFDQNKGFTPSGDRSKFVTQVSIEPQEIVSLGTITERYEGNSFKSVTPNIVTPKYAHSSIKSSSEHRKPIISSTILPPKIPVSTPAPYGTASRKSLDSARLSPELINAELAFTNPLIKSTTPEQSLSVGFDQKFGQHETSFGHDFKPVLSHVTSSNGPVQNQYVVPSVTSSGSFQGQKNDVSVTPKIEIFRPKTAFEHHETYHESVRQFKDKDNFAQQRPQSAFFENYEYVTPKPHTETEYRVDQIKSSGPVYVSSTQAPFGNGHVQSNLNTLELNHGSSVGNTVVGSTGSLQNSFYTTTKPATVQQSITEKTKLYGNKEHIRPSYESKGVGNGIGGGHLQSLLQQEVTFDLPAVSIHEQNYSPAVDVQHSTPQTISKQSIYSGVTQTVSSVHPTFETSNNLIPESKSVNTFSNANAYIPPAEKITESPIAFIEHSPSVPVVRQHSPRVNVLLPVTTEVPLQQSVSPVTDGHLSNQYFENSSFQKGTGQQTTFYKSQTSGSDSFGGAVSYNQEVGKGRGSHSFFDSSKSVTQTPKQYIIDGNTFTTSSPEFGTATKSDGQFSSYSIVGGTHSFGGKSSSGDTLVSFGATGSGHNDNIQELLENYSGDFGQVVTNEKAFGGYDKGKQASSTFVYEVSTDKPKHKGRGRQYYDVPSSSLPATNKYEEYEIESQRSFGAGKDFSESLNNLDKNRKNVIVISQVSDANPILIGKLAGQCSCQSNQLQVNDKSRRVGNTRRKNSRPQQNDLYSHSVGGNQGGSVAIDGVTHNDLSGAGEPLPESVVIGGSKTYTQGHPVDGVTISSATGDPYVTSPSSVSSFPGGVEVSSTPNSIVVEEKSKNRRKQFRGKARYLPPQTSYDFANDYSPISASDIALTGYESRTQNEIDGRPSKTLAGAAYDRYGPGGWRSFDETLQGKVDCKRPGLFRHPKYCNKFYACNYDPWEERFTLHVFNCPIRLTYDSSISACNWPVGGPACANDNLLV